MTLPHAIYGSATGLGDFGILGATAGLDERVRSTIVYHASLEGSARDTAFAPIFSFYAAGSGLWIFSRTVCLGRTRRGNDYLVHAIVLDAAALARIDFCPFALERLFVSSKPPEGSTLKPLQMNDAAPRGAFREDVTSSLRALARGPLRLRIDDDKRAADVCREIHESLPPDDRVATTFCTRFSYGRNLGFRLAAFNSADETAVRETAPDATVADFPLPANAPDLFDRWTAEMRGNAEAELVGVSVLGDVREAFALVEGVRQLRRWTAHDTAPDLDALAKAAALVLRNENRGRAAVQSVLPGALAVDLATRLRGGQAVAPVATPEVRRAAVQWLRELKITPAELWMAEVLLLLEDAPLAEIAKALQRMQTGNAAVFRAFTTTLLTRLRDRFGADGAPVAAAAAQQLSGDPLLAYVRVMEETAGQDKAWLMAIVRDVFSGGAIAARIVLSNNLLDDLNDEELRTLAPAFFVMEEKLAAALATPRRPALYRELLDVAQQQLRAGWTPSTDAAAEVLRRVLRGGIEADASAAQLTVLTFLGATVIPADDLLAAIEHLAAKRPTPAQAALLLRTLQGLGRRGITRSARVSRNHVRALLAAARPPQNMWNRLGWYLRMQTLLEIAG